MDQPAAQRWQRIDTLLAEALDRPAEERTAYLRAACGHDRRLYDEVAGLLGEADAAARALGESAASFAEPLLAPDAASVPEALPPGARVGPYRVEGELGRGGMGVVYRARRADGVFDKAVALKLVKRGMDTDEVLRRFQRERQVLASLDHPGIARLLDGGAAADGRPFLVMELAEGEPVTDYAAHRHLGLGARVELFVQVCEAVRHAHRHLVVHRDLKPSNIVVAEGEDGRARVKLLDFGIAHLLDADADEALTQAGGRRLTPAYAAPEQLRGEAVTTATDVHALGVVLYELLAGERPPAPGARPTPPPSASAPDGRRRRLRGDLDTICLKALRERPAERYPSVEALADDLERYRAGEPVQARPASAAYRVGKFVRRHRVGVAAASAFVGLLAASVVALAVQQQRTAQERDRAEEITDLLVGVFEAPAGAALRGDTLTARHLVQRAASRLDSLQAQPALQAELTHLVGRLYRNLGDFRAAVPYQQRTLALWESRFGDDDPRTVGAVFNLGYLYHEQGQYARADSQFSRWTALRERVPAPGDLEEADRLTLIGAFRAIQARYSGGDATGYAEAGRLHREALSIYDRVAPRHPGRAAVLVNYGALERNRGNYETALRLDGDAVRLLRRYEGGDADVDPHALPTALQSLAADYQRLGRLDEAEGALREAIGLVRGGDWPNAPFLLKQLGVILTSRGRADEAEALLEEAVARLGDMRGPGDSITLLVQLDLGEALWRQGRFEEAEALMRAAYDAFETRPTRSLPFARQAAQALAALYDAWERPGAAARYRAVVAGAGNSGAAR